MTFSTRSVVDLVSANFVPVWEPVAPVTEAVFDLGDGRELRGTVGGEIAIYFCRPDGMVFDILPALQSPAATRLAIEEALRFYETTGATPEAVQAYHRDKHLGSAFALDTPTWRDFPSKKHLAYRLEISDPGTAALSEMSLSKVLITDPVEPVLVVEPGGREIYEVRLHARFSQNSDLSPPEAWKGFVFEEVLGQELKGGHMRLDGHSLQPMSVSQ